MKRLWIAGHTGLLGSALVEAFAGRTELLTVPRAVLDLRDSVSVAAWLAQHRPDTVILAAARVGGIAANLAAPASFLLDNLAIQNAVLPAAQAAGVSRLICFGSSAMYPAQAPQPLVETSLHTGPLDPALRPYVLAKLAGMELCAALRHQQPDAPFGALCLVAPNLYGPRDHFGDRATVLPALVRRVAEARAQGVRSLTVWGTGRARRELLHAADLAAAVRFLLALDTTTWHSLLNDGEWPVLNVGAGQDISIAELAMTVGEALDWPLELHWDTGKPEGMLRKLMDSSRIHALGWQARMPLVEGIRSVYSAARADGRLP